jgi:hypothetical protein
MRHALRLRHVRRHLQWIGACTVVALVIARPAGAQGGGQTGDAPPAKAGCPFKALTAKVQTIFGAYDRALFNGGVVEGGEIPNVVKVRELTLYTCVFQRDKTRETLQFIANFYPDAAQALDAFHEASRAKNAAGAFYTSSRQDGNLQVFEGPGRSLAYADTRVVIVHWMAAQNGKLVASSTPGATLTPLAELWLAQGAKK